MTEEKDFIGTKTEEEEAAEEHISAAQPEEMEKEEKISAKPESVQDKVPERPRKKPHRDAEPCANWPKYYPGSKRLKKDERPCQGWVGKREASQCHNCWLEERYVEPKEYTYEVVRAALDAAKKFFIEAIDEFKGTPQATRAASILNAAMRSFEEGPKQYDTAYRQIQETVPLLLASEASWLENRLRVYLKIARREAELGRVDQAVARYASAVVHANEAAAERNGYASWVPAFDLRRGYEMIILDGKRRKERRHYVNGLREQLDGYFPKQGNGDRNRR